jgi:hypothetical protein
LAVLTIAAALEDAGFVPPLEDDVFLLELLPPQLARTNAVAPIDATKSRCLRLISGTSGKIIVLTLEDAAPRSLLPAWVGGHQPRALRLRDQARRLRRRFIYQGIDTEEIIATVHARRAPMMSATAALRL